MSFFKRQQMVIFYMLAFLLAWLVWGSSAAQARGALSWHIPGIFAFVGVATAAFVTAALADGKLAVRDLLARLVRWRVHPIWYIVSILFVFLLAYLAIALFTIVRPNSPVRIGQDLTLSAAVLYFLTNLPNMWLTEETAWRGFALPRFQRKYNALTASLIVGFFWGIWHLPLFLTPGSFQSTISFGGFVLAALATSVLTTWVFNHSRGSVLVAAILHSATDAAISYTGVMSSGPELFWLFVILLCLAAVVVVVVEGPARLMRSKDMDEVKYLNPADASLKPSDAG